MKILLIVVSCALAIAAGGGLVMYFLESIGTPPFFMMVGGVIYSFLAAEFSIVVGGLVNEL
jgi:hypothetical protein